MSSYTSTRFAVVVFRSPMRMRLLLTKDPETQGAGGLHNNTTAVQRNPTVESFDHLESATINWRTKVLAWRCLAWITTNENPIMQNGFTHIRDPLHLIDVHVRRNLLPIPPRPFETHCFLLNSKCTRLLAALQDDLNVPM